MRNIRKFLVSNLKCHALPTLGIFIVPVLNLLMGNRIYTPWVIFIIVYVCLNFLILLVSASIVLVMNRRDVRERKSNKSVKGDYYEREQNGSFY